MNTSSKLAPGSGPYTQPQKAPSSKRNQVSPLPSQPSSGSVQQSLPPPPLAPGMQPLTGHATYTQQAPRMGPQMQMAPMTPATPPISIAPHSPARVLPPMSSGAATGGASCCGCSSSGGGAMATGGGAPPNGSSSYGAAAPRPPGTPSKVAAEESMSDEERARARTSQAQYAKMAEDRAAEAMAKTGGGGGGSSSDGGGGGGGGGGAPSSRMSTSKKRASISIAAIPGAKKLERLSMSWTEHKAANRTAASGGANSKLLQSDQDLLEDPGFVKNVCALMQDPHICSTFAVFDQDGSGSISTTELKEVVTMLQLASNKTDLETILEELDINKDGGIDLWEFCVYLQKTKDRRQLDESNWELDQAFQLFDTDEAGTLGIAELRIVMQADVSGMPLDDEEFDEMVASFGLKDNPAGRISIEQLRGHECWQPKELSQG